LHGNGRSNPFIGLGGRGIERKGGGHSEIDAREADLL
jgi:hypothetical protein